MFHYELSIHGLGRSGSCLYHTEEMEENLLRLLVARDEKRVMQWQSVQENIIYKGLRIPSESARLRDGL